jgi:hypothetical protein
VAELRLVRCMRATIVVLALLPVMLVAEEPKVSAPISSEDVRQIRELVHTVSTDPIGRIDGVLTSEYVPGSVPRETFHFAADGTRVPSRSYERADLVWAMTLPKTGLPIRYQLEKSAHGWKIIRKHQMVD